MVAMQLIVQHVKDQLKKVCYTSNLISSYVFCLFLCSEDSTPGMLNSLCRRWITYTIPLCRSKLLTGQPRDEKLPSSVHILPEKPQVKGMHTVIRYHIGPFFKD